MIKLTIDGKEICTPEGKTILEAAREAGIYIPALCSHKRLLPIGSCRICVVEVEGYEKPMPACNTPVLEGISVTTQSDRLSRMRREFIKFLLVSHPTDCPQCDKGGECRLQDIVYEHEIVSAEYASFREDKKEGYAPPAPAARCGEGTPSISPATASIPGFPLPMPPTAFPAASVSPSARWAR